MGASFLKQSWLIPPKMQGWQRAALRVLRAKVPNVADVIWVFSSGTQSVDSVKCIALPVEAVWESARAVNRHLDATRKDVWSVEIPPYHVGGYSIFARARLSGSKVVRAGSWDPARFAARIKDKKITLTSLVPTQVFDLVSERLKAPRPLRAAVVGGGALDSHLYDRARELGWPLLPSYGLTECASQVATASLDSLYATGFPGLTVLPHVRVDFRQQRVFLQCLSICRWVATSCADGRFTLEDPLRDGWFATEDLGEWKGVPISGRPQQIRILGRQDDVVKVFGVLVSLPQVESDLRRFLESRGAPSADFTLMGAPGGREGASIVAVAKGSSADVLLSHLPRYNASVTGPFRIASVKRVASIPRTALGKVKKAELREALATALAGK